ncbi:hypothetical protein DV515_00003265 [Chloebia gouldiae]|uniref:Uncharacterized protein n=1 Tax=Chloebia gouldiae TaxID=44316 RepID=A0A3L8STF4_CHLGU|nr:hypothetical protein DV515_00003265 [Chloebia gouldiae]
MNRQEVFLPFEEEVWEKEALPSPGPREAHMGNSPPSGLDVSGDVTPAPTDYFHMEPGSLLFPSPQSWPHCHVPQPVCIKE